MKKILLTFALAAFIVSCNTSDDNKDTDGGSGEKPYANGFIVSNEGQFTLSTAEISFIPKDLSGIQNSIFKNNNNGAILGDVAQSILFHNDLAFIVMNNSNEIQIVNRYTFKKVGQITEKIKNPRYMTFANNKLYVTNAIDFTVTIYDATTFKYIKSITLDALPEKVVATPDYVYVQSASYALSNRVEIIDTKTDTNVIDITFSTAMNGIVLDDSTKSVYVIGSSETSTEISKIEKLAVTTKKSTDVLKSSRHLALDQGNLYFVSNNGVYTIKKDLNSYSTTPVVQITGTGYGLFYGFNVIDGNLFVSDAKDFTGPSEVNVYDTNGTLKKKFTSGVATNGFYKN